MAYTNPAIEMAQRSVRQSRSRRSALSALLDELGSYGSQNAAAGGGVPSPGGGSFSGPTARTTGGAGPLAAFLRAISGQESGGSYSAVNRGSGALGRYQVMPGNVAGWSRQVLGHPVSPQQFLADPALQERVVAGILGGYYRQYGPRGAAAAWYSGQPGRANDYTRLRNRSGPSVGDYVDQVLRRIR